MFESLISTVSAKLPDLATGYKSVALLPTPKSTRLDAAMFSVGGINYLYGGHNDSYTVMNDLYSFTSSTALTAVTDINLGANAIAFPKAMVNGTKVYIFGVSTTGFFSVKIIDTVAKTSETITHTTKPTSSTLYVPAGIDFHAGTNSYYMKFSATNVVARFDLTTKSFSVVPTTGSLVSSAAFVGNEFLVCGTGGIFVFAGWNVSMSNMFVHKIPYGGGDVVDHGRMEGDYRHSVNQGNIVKNKICYYPTWSGAVMTFNAFDPENLRHGNPLLSSTISYRNVVSMGPSSGGFFWGGGTATAVGGSGWTTANRRSDIYEVQIDFNANPPF